MKFVHLILAALSLAPAAQAGDGFYKGQPVTVDAPTYADHRRVGKVSSFNGVVVTVEIDRILFDQNRKPKTEHVSQVYPKEFVRPALQADIPVHPGQLVRVNAKGFLNDQLIAKVKSTDGRSAIVEAGTDPTTLTDELYDVRQLKVVTRFDYVVFPGDMIRMDPTGYPYSGIIGEVLFNNGARVWTKYRDNAGQERVAVIPHNGYTVMQTTFHADFGVDLLGRSLLGVSQAVYGSKAIEAFFSTLGRKIDVVAPLDADLNVRNPLQARSFVVMAIAPVIRGADSEVFQKQIIPVYEQSIVELGLGELREVRFSQDVLGAAALVAEAAVEGMLAAVSAKTDVDVLTRLKADIGVLRASTMKRGDIDAFFAAELAARPTIQRLQKSFPVSVLAVTLNQVVEYMTRKN